MKRTLLVLGASHDQLFLIRTARSLGLRVLAVDKNPRSPGFAEADAYAVVSTRDVPELMRLVASETASGQILAGVVTMGSDIPDVVAALSEHFGTPSISTESARLATRKDLMKQRFVERGVPTPWFRAVRSLEELRTVIAERGMPLVLKPVDRSGSRGVFRLDHGCDIERLFCQSVTTSLAGICLVEEYVTGLQVSTETVMVGGTGITPGFADRNYELLPMFLPRFMENGGWVPSVLTEKERRAVESLVVKASLALGVRDGITKGDVVMGPDGPQMIEMACRLSGGDFCESLVPLSSGVNYVEAAVQLAIGVTPDLSKLTPQFSRAVANRYFFADAGRLLRVEGLDEVCAWPGIRKVSTWYDPGDEVRPVDSHAGRFGVFIVEGETRQEVQELVDQVYATVRIVVAPE